jgi:3-(3-hydroxy-phenyl)propionate hydroxylase
LSGRPENGEQAGALVVGAGPVGLTTALALRSRGVPVTVLEADPEDRVRPGSRALFVHRESLSALDRMRPGLGSDISRFGVVWRTRRTLFRGRQVFVETFPPPSPAGLPPFTSLRQVDTERFLLDACRSAGVHFRWGAHITGVTVGNDDATVVADDGARWTAPFVIAADGAHSAVRKAIGVALRGPRSSGYHVVVDVAEHKDHDSPAERVFHYEHPGMSGRTVLRVPFAGGFQVDLQCRDDDPAEAYGTEEAVRRWLPTVAGDDCADRILWVSTYRFLQVVAERFTDTRRRVLLVGEAAHLFPPFGARGMNSGIADADSAAEAVAAALAEPGRAVEAVDGFARTRHAAASFNSRAAGAALAHLRPGRAMRARQHAAALLAPLVGGCGSWLEHAPYGPRHGSPGGRNRRY